MLAHCLGEFLVIVDLDLVRRSAAWQPCSLHRFPIADGRLPFTKVRCLSRRFSLTLPADCANKHTKSQYLYKQHLNYSLLHHTQTLA